MENHPSQTAENEPAAQPVAEAKFKAISTPAGRRGIKLEDVFWETLEQESRRKGITLGQLVHDIENSSQNTGNVTSALRVYCMQETAAELIRIKSSMDERMIRNLLFACPSPAISLLPNKQLHAFNQPFIDFVAKAFSIADIQEITSQLRLALDQQLSDIEDQLSNNGNRPINVGIVIGVNEKRVRAAMSTMQFPNESRKIFIGFVQK